MIKILAGFVVGVVLGFLIFAYTPIGNRYFLKHTNNVWLYKIDKWTGETWSLRYAVEEDEHGDNVRIWYWSELVDEDKAREEALQIRGLAKKAKEREAQRQELLKQQEAAQKEQERQIIIAKKKELIDKAKNIHKQCGNDAECIVKKCTDIEGPHISVKTDNIFDELENLPAMATKSVTNECYEFARIFLAKTITKKCKDSECIKQYCKDEYNYWYPSEIERCANDIIAKAAVEIE